MAESYYVCETDDECEHRVPHQIWKELDSWRCEHDHNDLYVVCAEHSNGYEVLRTHDNFCVIRDAAE